MLNRKEKILTTLKQEEQAISAIDLANKLQLDRANVSRYLNELAKEGKVLKSDGRPVLYQYNKTVQDKVTDFENLVGYNASLKTAIQKAKAAILYPPRGLHTLLFGETGTGKSLFAECMYNYAKDAQMIAADAPFITFNCADYAQNPQLLFAHIFGVKKGAFTGAEQDSEGLVAQADGGILFLDEIHRLPPEGQEMLFTFIDKGIYRPLGESNKTYQAKVQIIGATTEKSSSFLTTFNRRIPMSIELPALRERTLEERFEIATYFLQLEANRLNVPIIVERDVLLALMTYPVEANVGQVKRDVKLISAKAFLQYQLQAENNVIIKTIDLPINIQKGLLSLTQKNAELSELIANIKEKITFLPGSKPLELFPDKTDKKELSFLESLPTQNQLNYFHKYIDELQESATNRYKVAKEYQDLAIKLYEMAEVRLVRNFDEPTKLAFALHLQTMFERIKSGKIIKHPNLTTIRRDYLKEFQVAMELSEYIEAHYDCNLSMDEIGFMTMFLIPTDSRVKEQKHDVEIIVLMHGQATATSMLQTVQGLLNTSVGIAFDMALDEDIITMYNQVLKYIQSLENKHAGILLLTDMGSLTRFGEMLAKETGVAIKTITMTSTVVVLEALRLSLQHYPLTTIYQNLLQSMGQLFEQQGSLPIVDKPKAIIVTCFTGEGVAPKLEDRLAQMVNTSIYKLISLQFLEQSTFRQHIDDLQKQYEIKAIVGTVAIQYQNIPYFSVIDIFDDDKKQMFLRLLEEEVPLQDFEEPLTNSLVKIKNVRELLNLCRKQVHLIQHDLGVFVEANIEAGIILHLAFLIDKLLAGENNIPKFANLESFKNKHKLAFDVVTTQLLFLEQKYQINFSEDDRAYITQMISQNRIDSKYIKPNLLALDL